jgi:hypothetical protein
VTTRPTREEIVNLLWLVGLSNATGYGHEQARGVAADRILALSPAPAEPLADQGGDEAEVAFERIAEPDWWLSEIGVARRNSFLAGYRAAQAKARPREPTEEMLMVGKRIYRVKDAYGRARDIWKVMWDAYGEPK